MPDRHQHDVGQVNGERATLLLMPAWNTDRGELGVKLINVFPGNARLGHPSVVGVYIFMDGTTGAARAVIDGTALTVRRTAAASALASDYLSRPDSARLLMVGSGNLAPHLVRAHAVVRPLDDITVWSRSHANATGLAERLCREGFSARATEDLEAAAGRADIISCATLATEPLIAGHWLRPGTHLDLVGGFTPHMREADDEAIRRSAVYVDTRAGALAEAGDVIVPIQRGILRERDIRGDLTDLCRGERPGRGDSAAITLFKSVGAALEDLAAAALVARAGE